jgi:hypothetical protein
MAQHNGGGEVAATEEVVAAAAHAETSSLNGFGQATPETAFADRPELLVGAALLGGILLAGVVSRFGR